MAQLHALTDLFAVAATAQDALRGLAHGERLQRPLEVLLRYLRVAEELLEGEARPDVEPHQDAHLVGADGEDFVLLATTACSAAWARHRIRTFFLKMRALLCL